MADLLETTAVPAPHVPRQAGVGTGPGSLRRRRPRRWLRVARGNRRSRPRTPGVGPGPDDQFLIASNSKTFTAVLVMQLRDEGKLTLDDTLDRHIPEVTPPGLTIRQALAHVTGHAAGARRRHLGDAASTPTARSWCGFQRRRAGARPHHLWHYSNLVFSMLGEVVARVDGREW